MKKLFSLMVCAIFCTMFAYAQKGEKAAGISLSYGTKIENIGIGIKGQYGITDVIRIDGGFDYFLKKNGWSMFNMNINGHYLFPINENLTFYPLAGITIQNWKFKSDFDDFDDYDDYDDYDESISYNYSDTKLGLNLGGGLDIKLTDKITAFVEAKYQIVSDFDQFTLGAGIMYKF